MASSKSFASAGSMVIVKISLTSFLLFISSVEIVSGILAATSRASSGNCKGKPALSKISFIAASLLFSASIILITSPTGLLPSFSHCNSLTTTLSVSTAPLIFVKGINISGIGLSISAIKKAKPLLICRWPINSERLRSKTSFTTPCIRRPLLFASLISTRTVSPCKAVLKSDGRTIMSTSIPSILTKPIPERVISIIPFSPFPEDGCCFSLCLLFLEFFLPIL